MVADRSGRVFFADRLNGRVAVVEPDGVVRTLLRDGMVEPNGLALSPDQSQLFIADVAGQRVWVVDLASEAASVFAGTGEAAHNGDGGPPATARLFGPRAVAFAPDGSLYVMERQGSCIRRIRDGVIDPLAIFLTFDTVKSVVRNSMRF